MSLRINNSNIAQIKINGSNIQLAKINGEIVFQFDNATITLTFTDKTIKAVSDKDGSYDFYYANDNGIIEGYGQKKYTDETHPDWNIVEAGNWENGTFEGGILRYEYKRPVE